MEKTDVVRRKEYGMLKGFRWYTLLLLVTLTGCASVSRRCTSCTAQHVGASYAVVQMDYEGRPFRCWKLTGVSIVSEQSSDGIYWESDEGTLVHLSGNYNYVQRGDSWEETFAELGLTEDACRSIKALRYDPATRQYRRTDIRTVDSNRQESRTTDPVDLFVIPERRLRPID